MTSTDNATADTHSPPNDRAAQQILVAEDDPIFRTLLRTWLVRWGYLVTIAGDGDEAWKILQGKVPPRLIILDWMMPGIDGPELCRRIRAAEHSFYQYVLLVTAKDNTEDVITGLELGADDYLKKPFAMGELRARLLVGERILALQEKLFRAQEDLRFRATHDALTGLWNRAAVLDLLERNLHRARRSHTPTGVLMIDLDHFKAVNDTYGHVAGDAVLQEVARRITQSVRVYDFVGRYGGEELLVVLSECNAQNLLSVAERIRLAVGECPVRTGGVDVPVTVSIGAAVVSPPIVGATEFVQQADAALYEAKNGGRNRCHLFAGESAPALAKGQSAAT